MRIHLPIFFLVSALCFLAPEASRADNTVVIASPKRTDFVMAEGDLPENRKTGDVYVGGVYRTVLLIKQVMVGSVPEKTVTVDLVATSKENLAKAKAIVVILVKDEAGKFKALGWDELHTVACVPRRFVDQASSSAMPVQVTPGDLRCAYVDPN